MKNNDLFKIVAGLTSLSENNTSLFFSFFIAKNLALITPEIEILNKGFSKKHLELTEKHSNKDEKGNPIFKVSEDSKSKKYEIIDLFQYNIEKDLLTQENDELLEKECTIPLTKIKKSELEKLDINISGMQLMQILELIDES